MTAQEINRLIQGIFDGIFDSLTQAEPGGKEAMQASKTVLSLMKPGLAINPDDFCNPWTPANTGGSQEAAINTANLVDTVPKMASLYIDSGYTVSTIYKQILDGVNIAPQERDMALEQRLNEADAVLYRSVDITDPASGEVMRRKVESPLYREFLDNQIAYNNARIAYVAAYMEAQKTLNGQSTWPLIAATLQMPVKAAYDKWRAGGADKIEQALAILNTSAQNALQLAWEQAKKLYDGYGVTLADPGTGISTPIMRSSLLPSNWCHPASSGWTGFDSAGSNIALKEDSDFIQFGASAGYALGLFTLGGSLGHGKQSQNLSLDSSNLRISFQYTLVQIRRPWLSFNLLATGGWNLGNLYRKGQISNGSKQNQDDCAMPLLPTALVAVKDVKISADWSHSDWEFIKQQNTGGAGFAIGPFSIGGTYAHSKSKQTYSAALAAGKITAPGVQIIGFISQVVPFSPPQ